MNEKASLVITTIFDPVVLDNYYRNFSKYGHLGQVQVILIADLKTPPEAYKRCHGLSRRGLRIIFPTIQEQEAFLSRLGLPSNFILYNSDNRRNIGYLMALESKSDFVISMDDDNYPREDEDFFMQHSVVCNNAYQTSIVNTNIGWFNICAMLELDRPGTTYPRGFPYFARHKISNETFHTAQVDVHMNAGLWLIDPDVDGISWLVAPAHTISLKGKSLVLGDKAWSPINTQNTSMRRAAIPSNYFVRMNYPLAGIPIDRYGDIFSAYFSQACVRHLNGAIRVGTPLADHKRNTHNYMKDAAKEWACIMVLEDILSWLPEAKLSGANYIEAYGCLSYLLEDVVETFKGNIWTDVTRGYFHQMAYYMRKWVKVCKTIDHN